MDQALISEEDKKLSTSVLSQEMKKNIKRLSIPEYSHRICWLTLLVDLLEYRLMLPVILLTAMHNRL